MRVDQSGEPTLLLPGVADRLGGGVIDNEHARECEARPPRHKFRLPGSHDPLALRASPGAGSRIWTVFRLCSSGSHAVRLDKWVAKPLPQETAELRHSSPIKAASS